MQLIRSVVFKLIAFSILFCFKSTEGIATDFQPDFQPWYGRVLEIDGHIDVLMESYHKFATNQSSIHQPTRDVFYEIGASIAGKEDLSLELDVICGVSRQQSFGCDAALLTSRKRLWNDIVGDPLSISTGLTISQVFKAGLRNISAFYHGGIQCETHIAAGKEFSCMEFWTSRCFGVIGIGIADLGSPWLRGRVVFEHNWYDRHQLNFFANTLWGFGNNALNPCHFRGYGSIQHQSVDVGARYKYDFESGIKTCFEYSYRCFAKNCPKNASIAMISVAYSFGL